jgi:hypothetical protein
MKWLSKNYLLAVGLVSLISFLVLKYWIILNIFSYLVYIFSRSYKKKLKYFLPLFNIESNSKLLKFVIFLNINFSFFLTSLGFAIVDSTMLLITSKKTKGIT